MTLVLQTRPASGTVLGIAIDHYGPVALCVLGGMLQGAGLLLMGVGNGDPSTTADTLFFAFVMSGIGGTALVLQSLKLAFIVAPRHFALVMATANLRSAFGFVSVVCGWTISTVGFLRLCCAVLPPEHVFGGKLARSA